MVISFVCEPASRTESSENVSQLTHCRIGEYSFDIVRDKGDECGHTGGDSTDPCDEHRQIREVALKVMLAEQWEHACNEVETRVDHRRCVDESRDRGWTLHRIWQPNM